ncbi:MAG: TadE/TadG family type IV pilus assembly protein [Candidatus Binataceae bacterium]
MPSSVDYAARSSKSRRYAAAQSATELALIVPAMVFALLAAVEMGRLGYLAMTVDDAARAGAQYGAENYTTDADFSGMRQAAINDASNIDGADWWGSSAGFSASAINFCQCADGTNVSCASGSCSSGVPAIFVQVKTQANYVPMFDYPGLPAHFTLKGSATMRVQ